MEPVCWGSLPCVNQGRDSRTAPQGSDGAVKLPKLPGNRTAIGSFDPVDARQVSGLSATHACERRGATSTHIAPGHVFRITPIPPIPTPTLAHLRTVVRRIAVDSEAPVRVSYLCRNCANWGGQSADDNTAGTR